MSVPSVSGPHPPAGEMSISGMWPLLGPAWGPPASSRVCHRVWNVLCHRAAQELRVSPRVCVFTSSPLQGLSGAPGSRGCCTVCVGGLWWRGSRSSFPNSMGQRRPQSPLAFLPEGSEPATQAEQEAGCVPSSSKHLLKLLSSLQKARGAGAPTSPRILGRKLKSLLSNGTGFAPNYADPPVCFISSLQGSQHLIQCGPCASSGTLCSLGSEKKKVCRH